MDLDYAAPLHPSTLIMVWISSTHAALIASHNLRIIHAPSDYFYLDCGSGSWLSNDASGRSWCDPYKTWQKAYTFDPLANLTSEQATLVMGGACRRAFVSA